MPPGGEWKRCFARALRRRENGDVLLLAEEAPSDALRVNALIRAARRLCIAGHPRLARAQLDSALALAPGEPAALRERAHVPDALHGRKADAPAQALLFSGHMTDAPGRNPPRFPVALAAAASSRIAAALDHIAAGPSDVAFCQAAAGGDLLFLEACLDRGVQCRVLLPFPEAQFVERSVRPSANGGSWAERYDAVRARLARPPRVMEDALGPTPPGSDPYVRCNRWLLACALAANAEALRVVVLWDGGGGDGPGGTAHLVAEARRHGARVVWIDTRTLG
jgi:hypothetical protein